MFRFASLGQDCPFPQLTQDQYDRSPWRVRGATSFAYYQLRLVVVNDSTMLFILDSSRIQHSLPLEPFFLKDSRQLGPRTALELSAQEWAWT